MNPVLIAGTGSWDDDDKVDWFCPGHAFGKLLTEQGVAPTYARRGGPATGKTSEGVKGDPKPFIWSTDLGGLPWLGKKDWAAGGAALTYFVIARGLKPEHTALIAHSHALQVTAFAAAEHNLKIRLLITMGSPIRADLKEQYAALRANTKFWLHVHSDKSDSWQWLGTLFDGHFGIVRESSLANRNDFVPKVGHSELLRDPKQYHHWVDRGWITLLKG